MAAKIPEDKKAEFEGSIQSMKALDPVLTDSFVLLTSAITEDKALAALLSGPKPFKVHTHMHVYKWDCNFISFVPPVTRIRYPQAIAHPTPFPFLRSESMPW